MPGSTAPSSWPRPRPSKADSAKAKAGPMQPAPGPAPIPALARHEQARRPRCPGAEGDSDAESPPGATRTAARETRQRRCEREVLPAHAALMRRSSLPGRGSPAQDTTSAASTRLRLRRRYRLPHGRSGHAAPAHDTTFVVDRVLAVVGNRPVLASQVDEEIFSRESQGAKLPDHA